MKGSVTIDQQVGLPIGLAGWVAFDPLQPRLRQALAGPRALFMTLLHLGRRPDTRWVLEPAFAKMLAHYLNAWLAQSTGQRIRFEPMSDSQLPTTASLPSRLFRMCQRPAPMNLVGPGCLSAQHFRRGFPQCSSPAARLPRRWPLGWGRQECRREAGIWPSIRTLVGSGPVRQQPESHNFDPTTFTGLTKQLTAALGAARVLVGSAGLYTRS